MSWLEYKQRRQLYSSLCALSLEAYEQRVEVDQGETLVSETETPTMAECRVMAERPEKIACMTKAHDAIRAENAALDQERAEQAETTAALGRNLKAIRAETRSLRSPLKV